MRTFFRFIKRFLAALIIVSLTGAIAFLSVNVYVKSVGTKNITAIADAGQAQAVIILGASVFGNTVSPTLQKRLDKGFEVYQSGKAGKIIVSGDHGQPDYNEVQAMKNYLVKRGVPAEDIFMDHAGFSTYDTVYRAKDIFLVQNAIIVTQREHLIRALYIADRLKLPAQGVEAESYENYEKLVQMPREELARIKAFLQCDIFHSKPMFLGDTLPVSGNGSVTDP